MKTEHFFVAFIAIALFSSSCNFDESKCRHKQDDNAFWGDMPACGVVFEEDEEWKREGREEKDDGKEKQGKGKVEKKESKLVQGDATILVDGREFLGGSLLNYPNLDPVEHDFEEAIFSTFEDVSDKDKLPIYRIEVDSDALSAFKARFKLDASNYQGTDHSGFELYRVGNHNYRVNPKTGRVIYFDRENEYKGQDVEQIDKGMVVSRAQDFFSEVLSPELFAQTYFYNYVEFWNSSILREEGDGEVTSHPFSASVALSRVLEGLPVVGSGGNFSIHIESDGRITGFDLQFANFVKKGAEVQIFSASEARAKLEARLQEDGISLSDHEVRSARFGYFFMSKKGPVNWLVPVYSFDVVPKSGVIDFARMYDIPASNDDLALELYNEDLEAEKARKAAQIDPEAVAQTVKD